MQNLWSEAFARRMPEGSLAAYGFAVACVLLATAVRLLFGAAGASLPFATYFPAVLITALLAGVGPGIFSIILSIIVVWWAFVGAPFAFEAPTGAEALNGALFAFAAALIVWLAARYRGVVRDLRQNEKARELITRLDSGDGVLLLVDVFGATPSNIVRRLCQPGRVLGVAGVNLPMLLRVVCYRDKPLAEVAQKALLGGRECIVLMTREDEFNDSTRCPDN